MELTQFDESSSNFLRDLLFADDLTKRQKWFDLIDKNPIFYPVYNITLDEQRELAYKRIKAVSDAGLFSIFDFDNDPLNLFTCHEMLA
jgi:hypothetical protein